VGKSDGSFASFGMMSAKDGIFSPSFLGFGSYELNLVISIL
jgi:hypothetical protein